MEQSSTNIFSSNWEIYQKIIANNHMRHKEIGIYFAGAFQHIAERKNIRVLDLGCGDAAQLAPVLKLKQVSQYTGYDLSQPALDLAGDNLQDLPALKRLLPGQMEVLIKQERDKFELIYSSYAIHHLQDDKKRQLLTDAYARLTPGGVFVMIDLLRKEGQNRDEYLKSYINWMAETWVEIDQAGKELVYDHIRNFDFPTRLKNILSWCGELGLTFINHTTPDGRHHMLTWTKSTG